MHHYIRLDLRILTHPIAAGHSLVHSGIHSSEANFALGLLLHNCGCSCPLRLQAILQQKRPMLKKNYFKYIIVNQQKKIKNSKV